MNTLLYKARPFDVCTDPFPHIVLRDPIDRDLYDRLVSEFPPLSVLSGGADPRSNQRFNILARDSLKDERITSTWRCFIEAHLSHELLSQFLRLFAGPIRQYYPQFARSVAPLDQLRVGVRRIDSFRYADILLDALLCVNSPVLGSPSSIRGPHLDRGDKLLVGLFYVRRPDDDSIGGDLELYRYRCKPSGFVGYEIDESYVEHAKTIEYGESVAIFFLNTIDSLHGVSPRHPTQFPRCFLNVVGEVRPLLFNTVSHQEWSWRTSHRSITRLSRVFLGRIREHLFPKTISY
jgi:hypothetical protein